MKAFLFSRPDILFYIIRKLVWRRFPPDPTRQLKKNGFATHVSYLDMVFNVHLRRAVLPHASCQIFSIARIESLKILLFLPSTPTGVSWYTV